MIFVLRKAGMMSAEYDHQISANELVKFNSQFEAYAKDDNTFFDVITASNLAYDVNKTNGYDLQNSVTVNLCLNKNDRISYSIMPYEILQRNYFFPEDKIANKDGQKYMYDNEFIKYTATEAENSTKIKETFTGTVDYSSITGKVNQMIFKIN